MKAESPDFDKQALIRMLLTEYALDVARLDFVPKGEESHSYIATAMTGRRYFVKIHMASVSPTLEACYRFVHHLYAHEHYRWVVAPHVTRTGNCLATLGERAVVVFDCVSGVSKAPSELTQHQVTHFAGQLAALHSAVAAAHAHSVPTETFGISFKTWLLDVLHATEKSPQTTNTWAQAAHALIQQEQQNILDVLALVESRGAILQAADLPLAVTHGDIASHNIIQDEQDNLLLIDWGKLCLAPAARDWVGLWEEGNVALIEAYFRAHNVPIAHLSHTLTYYLGYYLLAVVADYGSWLLLEEASHEEAENAWRGLQRVLPVDMSKLHATVAAINAIAANTEMKDRNDE